ncbi:tRNA (N6-isopentenyl adenosine(37)-C2)-methylthiotransferase MiaB [Maribellus sp. CM-23]|uniref:tRNA (N6-isopentenyl adenosine(37)-C2)-methylthiotransferase MiaB n=1 Tax=Maribellus sp. CM-23 TaxID=2781026 RepID=UPI001F25999D|nr:tRNA (N6-isopentenyl adenosine(37)-C2)-methylthiotransferase MiaB [Maribellus sp. CM-23]MCE4564828.1 tRNA (N6-isopentenyl adenosine(37)-C2)-methylthiotransferase MiaB [Maribellus sp. CM-23]
MKYHVITLGCQMNLSDGERVISVLDKAGYQWTDNEEEANLIGILACSVRQKAIDKVYSRIHKWNKWKNHKNLITFISGCILPDDHEKFLKLFDITFQMKDLPKLPEMISNYGITTPLHLKAGIDPHNENIEQFWDVKPNYQSNFEAFIPIQNGCDKFCSFCAVPYTRGREVSRPSRDIIAEVALLAAQGYKSITLLGQNVNSYGLDKKGEEITFPQLLREIGELGKRLKKDFWVYFTSPHPRDMTDEVIEVIAEYPVLAKQIHLPMQSGDDKVLMRMNRKHNMEKYRHIVESIRRIIPQATLFTDIIVGFTGETDEQFNNTRKAMEEFQFNMSYTAIYSPRPGATSHRWDDDVPLEEKKRRLHILTEELRKHNFPYNNRLVGKTVRVLVKGDDRKEGFLSGHTEGKLIVRFAAENESLVGQFVDVKITSASDFSMEGELVEAGSLKSEVGSPKPVATV